MMFFSNQSKHAIPPTPTPTFILTDTSSTITKSDASEAGSTPLSKSLDKRLTELQDSVGEFSPEVAQVLSAIGNACLKNEDYKEALRYYTQALDVTKKVVHPEHPDIADVLASIGFASIKLAMPTESKSNFNAALAIYLKAHSDRTWAATTDGSTKQIDYDLQRKIACMRAALGTSEFEHKNFSGAKRHFEDALLDSKRSAVTAVALDRAKSADESAVLSEARINVSEMFNNIASACAEQGDKEEAIKNYNSALALQIQVSGEDNLSVACTLHNIGTMHYRSGEFHFALKSYKQVLKMHRYLFGNEDVRIADVLLNIATVHEKADEIERCVSAISAANRISGKHHGRESVQCADINQRLAGVYARSKCEDLALENFQKALAIYQRIGLEDSHPSVEAVETALTYLENKNDENSASGIVSATEVWTDIFNKGCGKLCFAGEVEPSPISANGITNHPPPSVVTI